ncbi:cytochrome bd oxidase small subunit CydS [Siminovitchia terrae]
MHNFFIFYAPFIVLGVSIAVAFWAAPKDRAITKK